MSQIFVHYKDKTPAKTIAEIRNLLFQNDITVIEKEWHNSSNCYHSLTLSVAETSFSVNGKGVTPELALASAYGEFMERLQNMSIFRMIYDFSDRNFTKNSFYYAPDEQIMTSDDFLLKEGAWLTAQLNLLDKENELNLLMQRWKSLSIGNVGQDFVTLPFYHVNSGEVDYIPVCMLSKMYTSNGMAAGNTMEEALVQGISEIFERYATIQVLRNRISPPDIPREEIEANERINNMVKVIEKSGRYRLYFKDCSLGIDLPVVAALCIDSHTGGYFVKFGAHPVFEVAIERTLTELLQGQKLSEMKGMRPYDHDTNAASSSDNIYGILINGCGNYPYTFFCDKEDYEHVPYKSKTYENNQQMLCEMIDYITDKGWNLFVRDVSFMGFPACQIVMPGISEVESFSDIAGLDRFLEFASVKRRLENIRDLEQDDIEKLAYTIDKWEPLKNICPSEWLHIESKGWVYQNTYWLIAALFVLTEDFKQAAITMKAFLKALEHTLLEKKTYYFQCVRAYLAMRAEGLCFDQIQGILAKFYPKQMICQAINDFSPAAIIGSLATRMGNHATRSSKRDKLVDLYDRLNLVYSKNAIDQSSWQQELFHKK